MKLYTEISSERGKIVSKSGNEYIICEVIDEQRQKIITLHITVAKSHLRGEHYNIYISNHQSEYISITNEK